jgi:hypothetical protein
MTDPLADAVAGIAARLPDAKATRDPGAPGAGRPVTTVTWSRGGIAFAALRPGAIEIRLDSTIAAAATRTPDVAPSPRGREWIRFSPRALDGHAIDRLTAWLELAHRRAGE